MRRFVFTFLVFCVFVFCVIGGLAGEAQALRPHERDGWVLGLSYGSARGKLTLADGTEGETEDGVSPQIRFGRMVSNHFAVGLSYSGWMYETGDNPLKYRFSMQNFGLAATWYPGNPERGTGGIYVRFGLGLAWAAISEVEISDEEEQGHGDRLKENGLGVEFNLGYEFRLARNFAAGLGVGSQQLNIGGELYDEAMFFPVTLNLRWYF